MKKVAAIGDIHGCIEELETLYSKLEWHSLDEIRHVGDLVDRGPDSGNVVEFCRTKNIQGVSGNHESVLIDAYQKKRANLSPDKTRSIKSIKSELDWEYLKSLPALHIDDELKVIYVHAGLHPGFDFYNQPRGLINHIQLIHPDRPAKETRWFGTDRDGRTEEENRANGWVAWYEVWEHPYLVIYGHTVSREPKIFKNTIGIDTGCVFGGKLTAIIFGEEISYVSCPAKKVYYKKREDFK